MPLKHNAENIETIIYYKVIKLNYQDKIIKLIVRIVAHLI